MSAAAVVVTVVLLGATATRATLQLGMNLDGVTYYGAGQAFKDVWKSSRPFTVDPTLDVDTNGFVKSLKPGQTTWTLGSPITGHFCNGGQWCDWKGNTTVENYTFTFDGDCSGCNLNGITAKDFPGQNSWTVPINTSWHFKLLSINGSDYPRNFRLYPSRFTAAEVDADPWNPAYVDRLRSGFTTLRFMDWMSTNGNVVSEWSNRTLPSNNTQDQKGRGVAWEHIITLSNYLKINPWVNIPHLATDDYVANLAMLLRDTLSPDLVIHVEYSNEVWNFGLSSIRGLHSKVMSVGLTSNRRRKAPTGSTPTAFVRLPPSSTRCLEVRLVHGSSV
eukprot:m.408370 g.408370  ORF g.408370 m.408370 type:complete len:332 (-) comp20146_c0_seq3:930-1925(-)